MVSTNELNGLNLTTLYSEGEDPHQNLTRNVQMSVYFKYYYILLL